jgi:hypothetical protein
MLASTISSAVANWTNSTCAAGSSTVRTVDRGNVTILPLHNLLILKIKSYAMYACPSMFFRHRHNFIVQVVQLSTAQGSSHPTVRRMSTQKENVDLGSKRMSKSLSTRFP